MKKFYSLIAFAFLTASVLLSFSSQLQAQVCPIGKVFRTIGYGPAGERVNTVYVEGFQPNGKIVLWSNFVPIVGIEATDAMTDANGNGRIVYNGAEDPTSVTVSTNVFTCQQPVPVANPACTGTNFNAEFGGFCNIFQITNVVNGEVRAFDAFQNLVPTPTGFYPSTGPGPGVVFVGYPYNCTLAPTSITVCGPSGCCSYQVPAAASLPIKLKYFTAKLTNSKDVLLAWASELEINSDKFIVEKSIDGRNFKALADVKSQGNSTTNRSYAYTDGSFSSVAYYRLKMVDIDGKSEYSKVVYVNTRSGSGVVTQIFPNPFKSDIQIIGISSSDLNAKNIRVFSAAGQQVNFKITGANAISLDENAPRGVYILAIKEQRFKLIKE